MLLTCLNRKMWNLGGVTYKQCLSLWRHLTQGVVDIEADCRFLRVKLDCAAFCGRERSIRRHTRRAKYGQKQIAK